MRTKFEWLDRHGNERSQIVPTWSVRQFENFVQDLVDMGATNIRATTV